MNVEFLVSTMNFKDVSLLEDMNINTNTLIINQCDKDEVINKNFQDKKVRILSFVERGLSKSRNQALKNAVGDFCIIADDDMYYYEGIQDKISDITKKNPNVSVFIF